MEYARRLTSGDTKTPLVKSSYKRAIAAALDGLAEVATEAVRHAESIELTQEQEAECSVIRQVAKACQQLARREKTEVEKARRSLRAILTAPVPGPEDGKDQTGFAAWGYDSLTFLVFTWGRLIDSRPADDPHLLGDAALLVQICPERLPDPAALRHFKPYHDRAIAIRTESESINDPADVVAHVVFANKGYFPIWPDRESQLLFHFPTGSDHPGFAFLYRRDQSSAQAFRRFALAESEADIVEAVRRGADLSLPSSLRNALQTIGSEFSVVWPSYLGDCPYLIPGKHSRHPRAESP